MRERGSEEGRERGMEGGREGEKRGRREGEGVESVIFVDIFFWRKYTKFKLAKVYQLFY